MNRYRIALDPFAPAVDPALDFLEADHPPAIVEQQMQQRRLAARQVDVDTIEPGLLLDRIENHRTVADLAGGMAAGAALYGAQARRQLVEVEGLGDIVIGAAVKPGDALVHV